MKVVLKYVSMRCGAQCVMTPGTLSMLVWYVANWDTLDSVSTLA